ALVYQELGRYDDAARLFGEAEAAFASMPGVKPPVYPVVLNNLGFLSKERGDQAAAGAWLQRALDELARGGASRSAVQATVLDNLAGVRAASGNDTEAIRLYREAASLRQDLFGKSHPAYAETLSGLAGALSGQGQDRDAANLLLDAARIDWTN